MRPRGAGLVVSKHRQWPGGVFRLGGKPGRELWHLPSAGRRRRPIGVFASAGKLAIRPVFVKEWRALATLFLGGQFRERMVIGDEAQKPLFQNMGVDLRRADIGMAEQFLHGAKVGAVLQEMAGEGVAQDMG